MKTPFYLSLGMVVAITSAFAAAQESKPDEKAEQPIEATSLLGQPLRRMTFSPDRTAKLEAELAAAKKNFDGDSKKVENIIWYGRRLAYLWRYKQSIEVFSDGIKLHPNEPRLFRHRGHRYITLRKFDLAIADLTRASELIAGTKDEVEPDGQPNSAGIPTSTLHTNIWYHLGLAHYLKRDFPSALAAYEKCLAASKNNDMRVATLDWMYLTLRRMKRNKDADEIIEVITPDLKVIENHAYHNRILMYRGLLKIERLIPSDDTEDRDLDIATFGFGVGTYFLVESKPENAYEVFRQVTLGKYWAAFGYIAAEAELAWQEKNGKR